MARSARARAPQPWAELAGPETIAIVIAHLLNNRVNPAMTAASPRATVP